MKKIAYLLVAFALIVGLSVRIFAPNKEWAYAGAGLALLLGSLLLMTYVAIQLWKGSVRLRPWDATKMAWWVFLVGLGVRLIAQVIAPDLRRDIGYEIFHSAFFAIAFSLYSTAYSKPA